MKLRYLAVLLLFLLVLVSPVIAADKISPIRTIGIVKEKVVEVIREQVVYPKSSNLLAPIERILGRTRRPMVDVSINDEVVATIPENSKYNGMEISKVCLVYQYGTKGWYTCENKLTEQVQSGQAKIVPISEVTLR